MEVMEYGSKDTSRAAIRASLSCDRKEERCIQVMYKLMGIKVAAVDYGGEFSTGILKLIERAIVAAKREGVIGDTHIEEGAVAGATREAVSQLVQKALGLNVGGKLGIARCGDHLSVAVFFEIGLLHLNEVAIGLGHRVI